MHILVLPQNYKSIALPLLKEASPGATTKNPRSQMRLTSGTGKSSPHGEFYQATKRRCSLETCVHLKMTRQNLFMVTQMTSWSALWSKYLKTQRRFTSISYRKIAENHNFIAQLNDKNFRCESSSVQSAKTWLFALRQWRTFIIRLVHEYLLSCRWNAICHGGLFSPTDWSWSNLVID